MKIIKIVMSLCFAAFWLVAFEAPTPEYVGWMKKFGANQKAVKSGDAKAAAEVVATAKEVGAWWAKKNDDVAAKAVAQVIAGAEAVEKGDASGAATMGGGCASCHMAHRGGSPGMWEIK